MTYDNILLINEYFICNLIRYYTHLKKIHKYDECNIILYYVINTILY